MTEKQHNVIHLGMFIGFLILFIICTFKCCNNKPIENGTDVKSDTVYIHKTDTQFIPKDTIIYKWKRVKDTIYLPADTALLVEQKMYKDSLSQIWISGIEPEIDSIRYFIPRDTVLINTEITHTIIEETKSGFGMCIGGYAGYGGYVKNGMVGVAPEIGLGASFGYVYIFKNKKKNKIKNIKNIK